MNYRSGRTGQGGYNDRSAYSQGYSDNTYSTQQSSYDRGDPYAPPNRSGGGYNTAVSVRRTGGGYNTGSMGRQRMGGARVAVPVSKGLGRSHHDERPKSGYNYSSGPPPRAPMRSNVPRPAARPIRQAPMSQPIRSTANEYRSYDTQGGYHDQVSSRPRVPMRPRASSLRDDYAGKSDYSSVGRSKRPRPPTSRPVRDERPRKRRDTRPPPPKRSSQSSSSRAKRSSDSKRAQDDLRKIREAKEKRDKKRREELAERKRRERKKSEDSKKAASREKSSSKSISSITKQIFQTKNCSSVRSASMRSKTSTSSKDGLKKAPKKNTKHDMKLQSVIFASGIPGRSLGHEFLACRHANHPGLKVFPKLRFGENDFSFVLEISEHEKDRRRKYRSSSHRGVCKWELMKRDIISVRTFHGDTVSNPGPQTLKIGSKSIPILIEEEKEDKKKPVAEEKKEEKDKEAEAEKPDDDEDAMDLGEDDEDDAPPEPIVVQEINVPPKKEEEEVEEENEEDEKMDEPVDDGGAIPEVEEEDPLAETKVSSLTVKVLRKECTARGLYAKGLKRELVARLEKYLAEKRARIDAQKEAAVKEENKDSAAPAAAAGFPGTENDDEDGDSDVILVDDETNEGNKKAVAKETKKKVKESKGGGAGDMDEEEGEEEVEEEVVEETEETAAAVAEEEEVLEEETEKDKETTTEKEEKNVDENEKVEENNKKEEEEKPKEGEEVEEDVEMNETNENEELANAEGDDVEMEDVEGDKEEAMEEEQKELEMPLIEIDNVSSDLVDVCGMVNELLAMPHCDLFVPDLRDVASWGNQENCDHYLEAIETPMCFTQLKNDVANSVYNSEKEICDSVNLIFKNAKTYNEDGSEWFIQAASLQNAFNDLYQERQVEKNLIELDEENKVVYTKFEDDLLKAIIEKADFKHSGLVEKQALASLAKEAGEALVQRDDEHIRNIILSCHRELVKKQKELRASLPVEEQDAGETEQKKNFWVVLALNHALREMRLDRDIVSAADAERSRLLILEFSSEISGSRYEKHTKLWTDNLGKEGTLHGCEKEDIWPSDEQDIGFIPTISKLIANSREVYEKEKKAMTFEELVETNKQLKKDLSRLESRYEESQANNQTLKDLLKKIRGLSDYHAHM